MILENWRFQRFRGPPDCGKYRRVRPFSRDSREVGDLRDSRDSSREKTPFVMTSYSVPDNLWRNPQNPPLSPFLRALETQILWTDKFVEASNLPNFPCNRKTYTPSSCSLNQAPQNIQIHLHFHFLIVSKSILRWCKFLCHGKLAAPKLTFLDF